MKTIEDRFWAKVDKQDSNKCWIWKACRAGTNGYGYFHISKNEGHIVAHRYSYQLKNGGIPEGMILCHTCDNPLCVNPDHLFIGTHQDNALDRESKKKNRTHGLQKLTEDQVREIKISKLSQTKLAKIYSVSRKTIASIQYGETWIHIHKEMNPCQLSERICLVCNKSSKKIIYIDNNYKYRKIRDDLCVQCHKALNMLDNNIDNLERAKSYLTK